MKRAKKRLLRRTGSALTTAAVLLSLSANAVFAEEAAHTGRQNSVIVSELPRRTEEAEAQYGSGSDGSDENAGELEAGKEAFTAAVSNGDGITKKTERTEENDASATLPENAGEGTRGESMEENAAEKTETAEELSEPAKDETAEKQSGEKRLDLTALLSEQGQLLPKQLDASLFALPALPAAEKQTPEVFGEVLAGSVSGVPVFRVTVDKKYREWLKAIDAVSVNGVSYRKNANINNYWPGSHEWYAEANGINYDTQSHEDFLRFTNDLRGMTTFRISAKGYEDVLLQLTKGADGSYTAALAEEDTSAKPEQKKPAPTEFGELMEYSVPLGSVRIFRLMVNKTDKDWFQAISAVSVNGESYDQFTGINSYPSGKQWNNGLSFNYSTYNYEYKLFLTNDMEDTTTFRISAEGYEDVLLQLTKGADGRYTAVLAEEDTSAEPEEPEEKDTRTLYVKLEGSFESAIVNQTDYDGVSSATGMATSSKNSNAKVYVARTEKDSESGEESEKQWSVMGLDNKNGINIQKVEVFIRPDTSKPGMTEDMDSGMEDGVNTSLGDSITLQGTPKTPGFYLVSVRVTDEVGRSAESNALPFRIYSGEEKLSEQLSESAMRSEPNFERAQDGKYMWKYMEPWSIRNFGSNVDEESESVRVPAELKLWSGSGEGGPYADIGYDLDWQSVEVGEIPQTLYIPRGAKLTMQNVRVRSSVRIIVEEGGRLDLRRSTVEGRIIVQSGGIFTMNYSGGKFSTGAILNGQMELEDGAIVENAAIVSHTNYLANGERTDRDNAEPVVVAKGSVLVRGQVFIKGDEAGSKDGIGQTALRVTEGSTVTLQDNAVLAVYGGAAKVTLNGKGGTALELQNGTVEGRGKLIAVGGKPFWGEGGDAVSGKGLLATEEAFLQGSTASDAMSKRPGLAVNNAAAGDVRLVSPRYHAKNGSIVNVTMIDDANDPLGEDMYWDLSKGTAPVLSLYKTTETQGIEELKQPENGGKTEKLKQLENGGKTEEPKQPENGGTQSGGGNSGRRSGGSGGTRRILRSVQPESRGAVLGAVRTENTASDACWIRQGEDWYLRSGNGSNLSGWITKNGSWYYLSPRDGRLLTGWQFVGGKWYLLAADGKMQTGWQRQDGKWYFLSESGALLLGTVTPDGYKVDQSGAWVE